MKNRICYLIGAGENYGLDFRPSPEDYVIAVDGGLRHLEAAGMEADFIIGDFDTLGYCPDAPNVLRLNPIKDDTDTLAALKQGIQKGYRSFHLYCCTGGRIEHTMANLQLLAFLSGQGLQGFLHHKDSVLTAITDRTLELPRIEKGFLSVFSHTDKSLGVFLRGLKYELSDAVLTNTFPLGISNEFTGSPSSISVAKGTLLLVLPKDILHQLPAVFQ